MGTIKSAVRIPPSSAGQKSQVVKITMTGCGFYYDNWWLMCFLPWNNIDEKLGNITELKHFNRWLSHDSWDPLLLRRIYWLSHLVRPFYVRYYRHFVKSRVWMFFQYVEWVHLFKSHRILDLEINFFYFQIPTFCKRQQFRRNQGSESTQKTTSEKQDMRVSWIIGVLSQWSSTLMMGFSMKSPPQRFGGTPLMEPWRRVKSAQICCAPGASSMMPQPMGRSRVVSI